MMMMVLSFLKNGKAAAGHFSSRFLREQAEENTPGGGMRVSRTPEAWSPHSECVKAAAEPQVCRKIKSFLFLRASGGAAVCACAWRPF